MYCCHRVSTQLRLNIHSYIHHIISTWRAFESFRQRYRDTFHTLLTFMTQLVRRRMHSYKSITFFQLHNIKNVYSTIRTGLRETESRQEDKCCVTRINDNACVIMWQPKGLFKKKAQLAVTIKHFLRDNGMIYHTSRIHWCVVFESHFSNVNSLLPLCKNAMWYFAKNLQTLPVSSCDFHTVCLLILLLPVKEEFLHALRKISSGLSNLYHYISATKIDITSVAWSI
jgi:hypothetical protein